ncbi:phosphotransferase [uncultured Bifidobacterium sp.]|uniref:phosphotransferase enzyme family protein n=1 Tax=uncultured Bifidobacterium sp. TaxID=165187 RepID=UPI0028DC059E|nr:phosphotransferase [uncultured Bifidobacterium sp.]
MVSSAQQRFNDLSLAEQETHFVDVARRALPLWGLNPDDCHLHLLNLTENATFRVDIGETGIGRAGTERSDAGQAGTGADERTEASRKTDGGQTGGSTPILPTPDGTGTPDSSGTPVSRDTTSITSTTDVRAASRRRIVMRVHRLDYAERDSIEVELAWIRELKRGTDLRLAEPLPGRNGDCVQSVDCPDIAATRNVVCFGFVTGTPPRDSQDDTESMGGILSHLTRIPDALTIPATRAAAMLYDALGTRGAFTLAPTEAPERAEKKDQSRTIQTHTGAHAGVDSGTRIDTLPEADRRLYRTIGIIAAKLRRNSVVWTPVHRQEISQRIVWDWTATFGEDWNNYYGCHYWDADSSLTRHDIEAIEACRAIMRRRLDAYGTSPARYGLIHSDLRPANLLDDHGDVAVLDFDDCGMGWYMTDIAGIVGFMEHRPDLPAVLAAVLEGYREAWPLDPQEEREIPTFIMLRRIGLFESLLYHRGNADPGANEGVSISPELVAFVGKGTAVLARKYVRRFRNLPLPTPAPAETTGDGMAGSNGMAHPDPENPDTGIPEPETKEFDMSGR